MSKKILIVSPHPDDATFSLGGYMLKNKEDSIIVWDIFSKQDYSICAEKHNAEGQILKEERQAMKEFGLEVILEGLPEAGLRGYKRLSDILNQALTKEKDGNIFDQVKQGFSIVMETVKPEVLYLPLGCGRHIDHLLARESVLEWWEQRGKREAVFLYEELPYSLNSGWVDHALDECMSHNLKEYSIDVSGMLEKKTEIMALYKSQIKEREVKNMVRHACNISKGKIIERVWRVTI